MNTMHNSPPVLAGAATESARGALILVHGRGGGADDMLGLASQLDLPDSVAQVALQASGRTWYPLSFLAPIACNQPGIDAGVELLRTTIDDLTGHGIARERMVLLGFSQGACLASEFLARHPQRLGGAAILTGGFIGPPGTTKTVTGSLAGMPILLGTSDSDPHVPLQRVQESAALFRTMGAQVDLRIYPSMPHTVNADELSAVRTMIKNVLSP
jgi:predicted esterase